MPPTKSVVHSWTHGGQMRVGAISPQQLRISLITHP
jgi:hypothetical protein